MKIKTATFITSVADAKNFLKSDKPIIAVAGKSNVGKSSFINMLANQKKLARTSNTPGRTRLVNYFDFGEFVLADLPGYGFASVSKSELKKWGELMEKFFSESEIAHVFSLVDIRHDPTQADKQMLGYLYHYHVPFTLITTKADKLAKTKVKPQAVKVANALGLTAGEVIATSSENRTGLDSVLSKLDQILSVYYEIKNAKEEIEEDAEN